MPLGLLAQNDRVGVGHRQPTEQLDVNGRMRVRTLPKVGSTDKIYTKPDGSYSPSGPDQTFTPAYPVVADANGVLGAGTPSQRFFYMPSIVLPVDPTATEYSAITQKYTVNLYERYQRQFSLAAPVPPAPSTCTSSPGSTGLPVEQKQDMEYYITYFDPEVFTDVQVDANGILTYKTITGFTVTENTFMNVVFKPKKSF